MHPILKKNFGIVMNVGDALSKTDPDIQSILKREANNMRELVLRHLYDEIDSI